MADEADQAQALTDLFTDLALRARAPEGPAATGACLFCDKPLAEGHRWCDADCRDDWERENGAG